MKGRSKARASGLFLLSAFSGRLPKDGFELLRRGSARIALVDFMVLARELQALLLDEGMEPLDGRLFFAVGAEMKNRGAANRITGCAAHRS